MSTRCEKVREVFNRFLEQVSQLILQKMLESLGLLKPLATLALFESVQLTLELVTLAGDCGVAPGGVAAMTVYLVWAVKGPSATIAMFCGLCVGMLKWFEKSEAPEPMTPKKVFQVGLERYSPLNGRAVVQGITLRGDIHPEESLLNE